MGIIERKFDTIVFFGSKLIYLCHSSKGRWECSFHHYSMKLLFFEFSLKVQMPSAEHEPSTTAETQVLTNMRKSMSSVGASYR